jgi:hypothetical protein
VLESLAYSNYASPRPQPIDPAVFFDLVKIRRLVEEATDLAVRAANGTTSSSLTNSLNASNGLLSGGSAAVLGLGLGGGGANTKLSRERKHRMRELATQKLSRAYHLDEIAASVATMQSASALEEVAKLVLQRNEHDSDAKYVHFFHEKIPSRSLASSTSLQPLDEVISSHPSDGAPYRTRAVTRMFKDDYPGAARDLTEGLAVCRMWQKNKSGLDLMKTNESQRLNGSPRDLKFDIKLDEKDHPSSLEPQLLFHRAGTYLTIACQHIHPALDGLKNMRTPNDSTESLNGELSQAQTDAQRKRLEARKIVKTNAKRALRDYMAFLSHLDYTPGLAAEITEEFLKKVNAAANGFTKPRPSHANRLLDIAASNQNGRPSDTLVRRKDIQNSENGNDYVDPTAYPCLPPSEIHQVSSLFSSIPPSNLPPYPAESLALVTRRQQQNLSSTPTGMALLANHDCHEAITYHPLLTDALHSVLLCHSLIQTSPKELLRHAHMSARLARVCDGYPIFLAARSPARADWIEVIRRANNWLGLQQSWETLCAPAPLPGHAGDDKKPETPEQARERRKHEAIMEALADERVQDEESFRKAVRAREMRAEEERKANAEGSGNGNRDGSKRWAQEDGKEYPISTERADAIARWIREAPLGTMEGESKARKGARKGKARKGHVDLGTMTNLENGVNGLSIYGEHD